VKLVYSHNGNSQKRVAYITFDEAFADYMTDIDRAESFIGSKYAPVNTSLKAGYTSYLYFEILETVKSRFSLDVFHVSDGDVKKREPVSILQSMNSYEKVIVLPLSNKVSRRFLSLLFSPQVPKSDNRIIIGTELDWEKEVHDGSIDESILISALFDCQFLYNSENLAIASLNEKRLEAARVHVFHPHVHEHQQNYAKHDTCIFILDEADEVVSANRQTIALAQNIARGFPALEVMVFQPPFSLCALHDAFKMAKFLVASDANSQSLAMLNDARSYGVVTLERETKSAVTEMEEANYPFFKYRDHAQAGEIIREMLSNADIYKEAKARQYQYLKENFALSKVSSRLQDIILDT